MSPKRRPRTDDRWDRTAGGLIVPRRSAPMLPTRRHIGKLGTAKDCCVPTGCYIWSTTRPSAITTTIAGITQGTCFFDCTTANGTWETSYNRSGTNSGWGAACYDLFAEAAPHPILVWFYRMSETEWTIDGGVMSVCRDVGYSFYFSLTQSVPFAAGSTYSGNLANSIVGVCNVGTWEIQT